MANRIEVEFCDGQLIIPSCFYEFTYRHHLPNDELFKGFVASSADKIFESTNNLEGSSVKQIVILSGLYIVRSVFCQKYMSLFLSDIIDFIISQLSVILCPIKYIVSFLIALAFVVN